MFRAAGVMGKFTSREALIAAAFDARARGFERLEAFTPFPVDGLADALGHGPERVASFALFGGVTGSIGGYFMQWFTATAGRPKPSWPAFAPFTFESTMLSAALCAVLAMLALNRLPELFHPVFERSRTTEATDPSFFLCVLARPHERFDATKARELLASLGALDIEELVDDRRQKG